MRIYYSLMIEYLSKERFKKIAKLNNKKYREAGSETFDVLIEGFRMISQILDYEICVKALFMRDDLVDKYLSYFERLSLPIYKITKSQSDILSSTVNDSGLFAQILFQTHALSAVNNIIYLNNITDPGNIGTILRTACAFENYGLVLDEDCCDLSNEKLIRSSMGAVFKVPILKVKSDWLFNVKNKIYICDSCPDGSISLEDIHYTDEPFIIVLGSEAHGISESIKKIKHEKIYIPISENMESLNVSVAAGIIMFYLKKLSKSKNI